MSKGARALQEAADSVLRGKKSHIGRLSTLLDSPTAHPGTSALTRSRLQGAASYRPSLSLPSPG